MKLKRLADIIFEFVTYINGVFATYEDKMWLRINILCNQDFYKRVTMVNNVLYVETI